MTTKNITIKFTGTIRKRESHNFVTIPAQYVSNGLLESGKEYEFVVKEKQKGNTK